MFVEAEDLMKTVNTLVKFNAGVFKSPKQSSFIVKALRSPAYGSFCPACAGLPIGEHIDHDQPSADQKYAMIEVDVKWADYGRRSQRSMIRLVEYDQFGVINMWKLHRTYSTGGSSSLNSSKYELLFQRAECDQLEALKAAMVTEVVEAKEDPSQYVGQAKDKLQLQVTVLMSRMFSTAFGYTTMIVMADEAGNKYVWMASQCPNIEQGQALSIKGTVKGHRDFRGVKQTLLTRCKVI